MYRRYASASTCTFETKMDASGRVSSASLYPGEPLAGIDSSREESYSFVYFAGDETSAVQSGSARPCCHCLFVLHLLFHGFHLPRPSSASFTGCLNRRTIARVRIDPLRPLALLSSLRASSSAQTRARGSTCEVW